MNETKITNTAKPCPSLCPADAPTEREWREWREATTISAAEWARYARN